MGAEVYDATLGTPMVLSCAHVFCLDQNANWVSPLAGIPIISPGQYDSGSAPADTIASLTRWSNLSPSATAFGDWAVATISNPSLITAGIQSVGPINGIEDFKVGDSCEGFGRTSGLMQGMIADVDAQIAVSGYGFGTVNFDNQIVTTEAIAGPGDSGSVLVNPLNNNLAGGLLFSGSDTYYDNECHERYCKPSGNRDECWGFFAPASDLRDWWG